MNKKDIIKEMKIREIMQHHVKEIKADATIKDALDKMLNERVTSLIVRGTEHNDYGIITRNDIIYNVIAKNKDPEEVKVSEVMSKPLITITPEMTLTACARAMEGRNLRHLPVVEDNEVIGFVSNSDIFKAIQ